MLAQKTRYASGPSFSSVPSIRGYRVHLPKKLGEQDVQFLESFIADAYLDWTRHE